jgi:FG-GAP repeat protein
VKRIIFALCVATVFALAATVAQAQTCTVGQIDPIAFPGTGPSPDTASPSGSTSPGSTLAATGGFVTFTWCNASADYFVVIESIPGAHDIFFAFTGGAGGGAGQTFLTLPVVPSLPSPSCALTPPVGCIPENGGTIHFTLDTVKNKTILASFQYTFTAPGAPAPTPPGTPPPVPPVTGPGAPAPIPPVTVPGTTATVIVTGPGPGPGFGAEIRGFDASGSETLDFLAYPAGVDHGVNVVLCDVDGDGVKDIITGPGPSPGSGPHVRGFRLDGTPIPGLSFLAYAPGVTFGVNVACGDLDGDGKSEIITSPGPGPGQSAHVRAFSYNPRTQQVEDTGVSFLAYPPGIDLGANIATGDLDGDGKAEIITGPGPGSAFGAHVRAFKVDASGPLGTWSASPLPVSFLAYPASVGFGVNVAAGDIDGDGRAEIITAPGPGPQFGAHVRAFRYAPDLEGGVAETEVSFLAYPSGVDMGARVAVTDIDGDGRAEIVTGPGPGAGFPAHVRAFRFAPLAPGGVVDAGLSFLAYPAPIGFGVNLTGAGTP